MRTLFLSVAFFLAPPGVVVIAGTSTPHLQPEDGFFEFGPTDPYKLAVGRALLEEHAYRHCQAVFMPSFDIESAVYILRPDGSGTEVPTVVSVELTTQLWARMMEFVRSEPGYSLRFEDQQRALEQIDIYVDRHDATIDADAVDILERVWDAMLLDVHHAETPEIGLDGVNYHFANFKRGHGYLAGRVWSPPDGSTAHDLVEIAEALRAYPRLPDDEREVARHNLVRAARDLLSRFEQSEEE